MVRDACRTVAGLLPDDAELGLWEFGTHLDGKRDYLELLPVAAMNPAHRKATGVAIDRVAVRQTGTGLYDTTLAAFKAMAARPRTGVPSHVLIFTDGRNEADPNSLTVHTLAAQLAELAGRGTPTNLTVLAFGTETDADQVAKAIKPVDGLVEVSRTDQDVAAASSCTWPPADFMPRGHSSARGPAEMPTAAISAGGASARSGRARTPLGWTSSRPARSGPSAASSTSTAPAAGAPGLPQPPPRAGEHLRGDSGRLSARSTSGPP